MNEKASYETHSMHGIYHSVKYKTIYKYKKVISF